MPPDEKIMHDHPESDNAVDQEKEHKATIADVLEKAMEPIAKPLSEDHPDPEEVEQRRRAEDADERN